MTEATLPQLENEIEKRPIPGTARKIDEEHVITALLGTLGIGFYSTIVLSLKMPEIVDLYHRIINNF